MSATIIDLDTEERRAADREEFRRLLDEATPEEIHLIWLFCRHLAGGEALTAAELDELRECCITHGFDLKQNRLA